MKKKIINNHQQGAALVIVMAFLAAGLIVGISGMNASYIDERLAGNYRATSEVYMGVETALSSAAANNHNLDDFTVGSLDDYRDIDWNAFRENAIFNDVECEEKLEGYNVACGYHLIDDGGYWVVALSSIGASDNFLTNSDVFVMELAPQKVAIKASAVSFLTGIAKESKGSKSSEDSGIQFPSSENSKIEGSGEKGDVDYVPSLTIFTGSDEAISKEDLVNDYGGEKTGVESDNSESIGSMPLGVINSIRSLYDKQRSGTESSGLIFHESGLDIGGNEDVEGLHVVLNGEAQIGGDANLTGALIVLNVENIDAYKKGDDSDWNLTLATKAKFNGGGKKGTITYNEGLANDALEPYGTTLSDLFGNGGSGGGSSDLKPVSWGAWSED